jgi:EAL domain-containing protein (putative c-di-GMP-specific phosphodiesterase class I)
MSTVETDRFFAFAFASSDLLVEIGSEGVITWAAGAFVALFGAFPETFVGKPLLGLIAPADHSALAMVISMAGSHGRAAPTVVRLNDAAQTPMVLAAALLPGTTPRLCVTVGPLPVTPHAPPTGLVDSVVFGREAEARLRSGHGGGVGLVELKGWTQACEAMNGEKRRALRVDIGRVLTDAGGPGAVTGEIGEGCFGVLGHRTLSQSSLTPKLNDLFRGHRAAWPVQPDTLALSLSEAGINSPQAVRALRFALGRFAKGGLQTTREHGFGDGLAGFIKRAAADIEAVRETLRARRFRLAFQPVVSLADRSVHHFEALLRPFPTRSQPLRATQDFVTFAEAIGLSEELDTAVVKEVLTALDAASGVSIAANVSGLSIQSTSFAERLLALLKPSLARRLLVELTETAEIENVAAVAAVLAELRGRGTAVCIDDFGAGAAAFRYLRDFRVDYVKIDGTYVRGAAKNARECGLVRSMLDLARTVDAAVIAEMIETETEARLMRKLAVQFGQGWLFGRPGALPGSL